MNPRNDLCSTRYCLADPGAEYLVYQPAHGNVTIDLQAGSYDLEWYDCGRAAVDSQSSVSARGGPQSFSMPASIGGDAVLYLVARP